MRKITAKKKQKASIGAMDTILIVVGVCLFAFTLEMISTFKQCGSVPDTLVTCVFAALGGECGIMGWIKTSKERYRERNFEIQDRKEINT